jgi:dTMP kinase
MASSGLFITFEGSEGCGKSTQIRRIAGLLSAMGCEVITLREPGGTPIGESIRNLLQYDETAGAMTPEAELLLFAASRAQLVREVIRPALERGAVVLCDRFLDSTTVYQGVARHSLVDRR